MLKMQNNSWRFGILLTAILLGGIGVNAWEYFDEAHVNRKAFKDFPQQIGAWRQFGGDERFDVATETVLRADDYVLRNYQTSDGKAASFYVGYYATQRNGATYHSPLNCLPGAGWTMGTGELVKISPENGKKPFLANRYIIQNGTEKQLMIYWYQGRGRSVSSEYWGKIYTVIDSIRLRRSDGAMVRIAIPVNSSPADASDSAVNLAEAVAA